MAAHLATVLDVHASPVPERTVEESLRLLSLRFATTTPTLPLIDPRLEASLVHLLAALVAAQQARDEVYAQVDDAELLALVEGDARSALAVAAGLDATPLQRAAVALAAAVEAELPTLQALSGQAANGVTSGAPIDLAPLLVVDTEGHDTWHARDALLVIDLGGNDTYDTNAGGSILHLSMVGDASTCQYALVLVTVDCENEDALQSFSASLLIDVTGDDTYGIHKPPRPGSRDAYCSPDPLVRRTATIGTGSGGLGMLFDLEGNDKYRGKTLAIGHGHIAGVGVFYDQAGDDDYRLIRSGLGSGILGGSGVFVDEAGHDTYTFAVTAGGHFNVDQGRCDATARLGLGSGVLGSTGHFVDRSGDDTYRVESQALGFQDLGAGTFMDLGGTDDYGGYPGRGNDMQSAAGAAFFVDRET